MLTCATIKAEFNAEYGDAQPVKGQTVLVGIHRVGGRGAPEEVKVRTLYE